MCCRKSPVLFSIAGFYLKYGEIRIYNCELINLIRIFENDPNDIMTNSRVFDHLSIMHVLQNRFIIINIQYHYCDISRRSSNW